MPKIFQICFFNAFLFVFALCPAVVQASHSDWQGTEEVSARLISAVSTLGDGSAVEGGLEIQLSKDWHTYWKNAGDAGLPPRFDWSGSENVENVEVLWPVPTRKKEFDFYVFGYDNAVTLPLNINLKEPGKSTLVDLKLSIMVCKDICIPQELALQMQLEPGSAAPSVHEKELEFVRGTIPAKSVKSLMVDTIVAGPEALVVTARSKNGFEDAEIFAYSDELSFSAPAEMSIDKRDPERAIFKMKKPAGVAHLKDALQGQTLYVTLVTRRNALETQLKF